MLHDAESENSRRFFVAAAASAAQSARSAGKCAIAAGAAPLRLTRHTAITSVNAGDSFLASKGLRMSSDPYSTTPAPIEPKRPMFDVYTAMLLIAFLALVVGVICLAVEMNRYDWQIKPL